MAQLKERQSVHDVVCGVGLPPSEAIAARVYKGQTYYFCCPGCVEAFERDPDAYIGREPVRAYRATGRVQLGADTERVRAAEAESRRYESEIKAAEERAERARDNVARLRKELDDARAKLAADRERVQELEGRTVAPTVEDTRILELERQVERERMELEAAERALTEAKNREGELPGKERTEAGSLAAREQALQDELRSLKARVEDLESRGGTEAEMRRELDQARSHLDDLKRQMEQLGAEKGEIRAQAAAAGGRAGEMGKVVTAERADVETQRRLEELESSEGALQADIRTQAMRVQDLEARISAFAGLETELEEARAKLAQRRDELQALGRREDEIRAALGAEDKRLADMQRQVEKERADLTAAQRALSEARARAEEIGRRRRGEISDLERTQKGAKADIETQAQRAESLEKRISELEKEAQDAERRAAELRDAEKRAQEELDRVGREHREVMLQGLPAVEGEAPAEFYRAEPMAHRRGQGPQGGQRERGR